MKILIVSDTHDRIQNFDKVFALHKPVDMVIHCGDVGRDDDYIRRVSECPTYIVAGNNDWGSGLEREITVSIGKYKAFITHGHYFAVKYDGYASLAQAAIQRGADIAIFGHIHEPVMEYSNGVKILNPGSLSFPRQEGRKPTYIIMEIDREGEAHYTVHELNGYENSSHTMEWY